MDVEGVRVGEDSDSDSDAVRGPKLAPWMVRMPPPCMYVCMRVFAESPRIYVCMYVYMWMPPPCMYVCMYVCM